MRLQPYLTFLNYAFFALFVISCKTHKPTVYREIPNQTKKDVLVNYVLGEFGFNGNAGYALEDILNGDAFGHTLVDFHHNFGPLDLPGYDTNACVCKAGPLHHFNEYLAFFILLECEQHDAINQQLQFYTVSKQGELIDKLDSLLIARVPGLEENPPEYSSLFHLYYEADSKYQIDLSEERIYGTSRYFNNPADTIAPTDISLILSPYGKVEIRRNPRK